MRNSAFSPESRPSGRSTLLWSALAFVLIGAIFVGGDLLQRAMRITAARGTLADKTEPARWMVINSLFGMQPDARLDQLLHLGLPVYDVRIEDDELARLQRVADEVVARGVNRGLQRPYENAQLCLGGQWVPVELKLRGLMADHYYKTRFSHRLKLPRNRYLHSAREISVLEPYDKGLVIDATTLHLGSQLGLLEIPQHFGVVRLNGHTVGLYQTWAHFGHWLADQTGRGEGFVFSGEGNAYAKPSAALDKAKGAFERLLACARKAEQAARSTECDERWLGRDFDAGRTAWAMAMVRLLHSAHAGNLDNIRLFWDPGRGRFEPSPWDWGMTRIGTYPGTTDAEPLARGVSEAWVGAPGFKAARDRRTWTLLKNGVAAMKAHASALFTTLRPALTIDLRHPSIATDEQRQQQYLDDLSFNAAEVSKELSKAALQVEVAAPQSGQTVMRVRNLASTFVQLRGLRLQGGETIPLPAAATILHSRGVPDTDTLHDHLGFDVLGRDGSADGPWAPHDKNAPPPQVPQGDEDDRPVDANTLLKRPKPPNAWLVHGRWKRDPGELVFVVKLPPKARISGLEAINGATGAAIPSSAVTVKLGVGVDHTPTLARAEAPAPRPGIQVMGKRVVIGPGEVTLDQTYEVPAGHTTELAAGLTLRMGKDAMLLMYGDLVARGTEQAPITIQAAQPGAQWRGIALSGTRSRPARAWLQHVHVQGGTGSEDSNTIYSAPLAIYSGEVVMRDVTFTDGVGTDGVNLKYCRVDLQRVSVIRSKDDAVDCDFCRGLIADSYVEDGGGDGFDLSGGRVQLRGNRVQRCNDKGFSIGERTWARIDKGDVRGCTTGVGAKDLSRVWIRDSKAEDVQVGIALYTKKQSFGAPVLEEDGLQVKGAKTRVLREVNTQDNSLRACPAPR